MDYDLLLALAAASLGYLSYLKHYTSVLLILYFASVTYAIYNFYCLGLEFIDIVFFGDP